MKTIIATEHAPAAVGPYSQAVSYGDLIFASGQIPLRPDGSLVEQEITAQAEQVFANIKAVLAAADSDLSKVIKATVFLADMNDFAAMNAVYSKHMPEPYPARSTIQVARLPRDVLVEIEIIASK
jgi:2-iminobutanoate/2-iminopropanoate deaminase